MKSVRNRKEKIGPKAMPDFGFLPSWVASLAGRIGRLCGYGGDTDLGTCMKSILS